MTPSGHSEALVEAEAICYTAWLDEAAIASMHAALPCSDHGLFAAGARLTSRLIWHAVAGRRRARRVSS
jgi:hypothetical protein